MRPPAHAAAPTLADSPKHSLRMIDRMNRPCLTHTHRLPSLNDPTTTQTNPTPRMPAQQALNEFTSPYPKKTTCAQSTHLTTLTLPLSLSPPNSDAILYPERPAHDPNSCMPAQQTLNEFTSPYPKKTTCAQSTHLLTPILLLLFSPLPSDAIPQPPRPTLSDPRPQHAHKPNYTSMQHPNLPPQYTSRSRPTNPTILTPIIPPPLPLLALFLPPHRRQARLRNSRINRQHTHQLHTPAHDTPHNHPPSAAPKTASRTAPSAPTAHSCPHSSTRA